MTKRTGGGLNRAGNRNGLNCAVLACALSIDFGGWLGEGDSDKNYLSQLALQTVDRLTGRGSMQWQARY